jgi:hypothetical protein
MQQNFKGMKKYENLLKIICNTEDLGNLSNSEWEGCLGVACIMSVKDGVEPTVNNLCRYLDISPQDQSFKNAFDRLRMNGVFTSKYNIREDKALNGYSKDTQWRTGNDISLNAWCILAGVASGYAGSIK